MNNVYDQFFMSLYYLIKYLKIHGYGNDKEEKLRHDTLSFHYGFI